MFDLGTAVALRNTDLFAPYKVATWADIPDALKDPNGAWVNDYGGYMSIGYDAGKVPASTSVADLLKPEYPRQGGAQRQPDPGLGRVPRRDDGGARQRRLGRRHRARRRVLRQAEGGRQLPARRPDAGDDRLGPDAGRHRLGVPQRRRRAQTLKGKIDWKIVVPEGAAVGAYYVQAINKDAPHPAAARLWQEFLYSDEGQNIWLQGFARPVRLDAMVEAGTVDKDGARGAAGGQGHAGLPHPGADRRASRSTCSRTGRRRSSDERRSRRARSPRRVPDRCRRPRGGIGRGPAAGSTARRPAVLRLRRRLPALATVAVVVGAFPDADGGADPREPARWPTRAATCDAFVRSIVLSAVTARARRRPRRAAGLGRRGRPPRRPPAPGRARGLGHARPVRRRDAGLRLPRRRSASTASSPCSCRTGSASTCSPAAPGSTSCRAWCWSTPTSRSR